MTPDCDRAARRRLATAYRSFVPDAVELKPIRSTESIRVSRRTFLDVYAFQRLRVQDQWREIARVAFPNRAI